MRIRSIKPEFWTDKKVASWDYFTRLFYIGLWSAADDWGCGSAEPARLAAELFPYDLSRDSRDTLERVSKALDQLSKDSRVSLYEVGGENYFQITNWEKHQKVDHPGKRWVPAPSKKASREPRETVAPGSIGTLGSKDHRNDRISFSGSAPEEQAAAALQPKVEETKAPEEPKKPQPRNLPFDALVEIEGLNPQEITKPNGSRLAKALKDIREVATGLNDQELAHEIRRRAEVYRKTWPKVTLSANALATHWAKMGSNQTTTPTLFDRSIDSVIANANRGL